MPPKKSAMSEAAIDRSIAQRVANALAEYETNRNSNLNEDGSHDSGSGNGRPVRTEGVIGLTQWFEKMESVFHISNCTVECQVKYATCTLLDQKVRTYAERQSDNKIRLDNNPGDNHDQQPPFKRQNVARTYSLARNSAAANNQRTLTCFECGNQGHYKSEFPKIKDQLTEETNLG
ncbi:hypothetical protein Tco_1202513 [Tanacetum coccineum]